MKFKKQNQHGAWAMVFMPLILGVSAGGFHPSQILYGIGWLLMFFAADHVLMFIKRLKRKKECGYLKAAGLFGGIAVTLFLYPLFVEYRIIYFFLAMLPLGAITSYFSMIRDERNIINDIVAISIFSIAGGGIAFLNAHEWTLGITVVILVTLLYFVGSALVVKTIVRERKNINYRNASYIYHALLFLGMLLWHYTLGIAFVFGLIRAIGVYDKGWTPKKLGIMEIFHIVWISAWVIVYLNVII
ncbi:YwiC-like family protein [Salinicoccus sp. YB14-2]|uniref:YwiC-like family protein n=1 Tax=Salinicoccus sp. YB14-2 TaxID=1572701 RepID=UPI0006906675|nr:YwiC-like family protein [Salinicoccus sp. YB14-2]